MKYLFYVALCVIIILNKNFVVGGKGRGLSRTRTHHVSHGNQSPSVGWFSWLKSGKKTSPTTTTTNSKSSPPSFHHKSNGFPNNPHIGFSAYGNNYQSNFHNGFQPVSHPYQSYFQPQTSSVFAYHFVPVSVHHVHHYQSNAQYPVYYDYRNSSNLNTSTPNEPIIYNYSPPANDNVTLSRTSSEENDNETEAINPNNYFIAGVENMLFYGAMKDNQHQVAFISQQSDGIPLESALLASHYAIDSNENLKYFPEIELRFDAEDEPNDDDLNNIFEMYRDIADKC